MGAYLRGEVARDLAHRREHGQAATRVPNRLHGESDAPGVEEGLHQVQVYRQGKERDEDQILPQVLVLFLHRPVDLDDDLGVAVDSRCLLDEACAGLLVPLVCDPRRLPRTYLDEDPVSRAAQLVDRVRGQRYPALPLRPLLRHTDPHGVPPWSASPRTVGKVLCEPTFHVGWTFRNLSSAFSAPRTPSPTVPRGTGVHDGANLTWKPASQRSNARACRVVAGAEPGGIPRAALVSRTASESDAVIARERNTLSRAEPRSSSERARISPRISRLCSAGSSVSTRDHRAISGRAWSVGTGTTSSDLSQESVAEKSIRPAVRVAMVAAGSLVGTTAVSRLSAVTRPLVPPALLSGQPLVQPRALPRSGRSCHPELPRRRQRSRRTVSGASRGGS